MLGDRLWVADPSQGTVRPLSLTDGQPDGDPVQLGGTPVAVAAGPEALWVADSESDTVTRIDSGGGTESPVPVGKRPVAVYLPPGFDPGSTRFGCARST